MHMAGQRWTKQQLTLPPQQILLLVLAVTAAISCSSTQAAPAIAPAPVPAAALPAKPEAAAPTTSTEAGTQVPDAYAAAPSITAPAPSVLPAKVYLNAAGRPLLMPTNRSTDGRGWYYEMPRQPGAAWLVMQGAHEGPAQGGAAKPCWRA